MEARAPAGVNSYPVPSALNEGRRERRPCERSFKWLRNVDLSRDRKIVVQSRPERVAVRHFQSRGRYRSAPVRIQQPCIAIQLSVRYPPIRWEMLWFSSVSNGGVWKLTNFQSIRIRSNRVNPPALSARALERVISAATPG